MTIRVVDLNQENVDEVLNVCTDSGRLSDRNFLVGLKIRREWLLDCYKEMGSCAKIAYIADKPVGVIQYTSLHTIPYFKTIRRDVLYIHYMYVQEEFRRRGIGSKLLEAIKDEMSKPNRMFRSSCRMLATSARRHYGYIRFGLFKTKGFGKTRNNTDVALICSLSKTDTETDLGIPRTKPLIVNEKGVKLFFKPTCQYCKCINERIKAEIRKINNKLEIEECNLWTCHREALRRQITSVVTYINGQPVLPMEPKEFLKKIKRLSANTQ